MWALTVRRRSASPGTSPASYTARLNYLEYSSPNLSSIEYIFSVFFSLFFLFMCVTSSSFTFPGFSYAYVAPCVCVCVCVCVCICACCEKSKCCVLLPYGRVVFVSHFSVDLFLVLLQCYFLFMLMIVWVNCNSDVILSGYLCQTEWEKRKKESHWQCHFILLTKKFLLLFEKQGVGCFPFLNFSQAKAQTPLGVIPMSALVQSWVYDDPTLKKYAVSLCCYDSV